MVSHALIYSGLMVGHGAIEGVLDGAIYKEIEGVIEVVI